MNEKEMWVEKTQQTITVFEDGNPERAYQLFLADESATPVDFNGFCTAMKQILEARQQ